jgi:hypothetical protein
MEQDLDAVILCNKPKTTIKEYKNFLEEKNREKIADFVYCRLTERYVTPMKMVCREYKNGFSIMANCCLLIETYESFRSGLGTTKSKSKQQFTSFFEREEGFHEFKDSDFYKGIRCGILHQGETTGGWKITRDPNHSLFDSATKRINANQFLDELESVLKKYCDGLKESDWDSEVWKLCRTKISHIIENCKST